MPIYEFYCPDCHRVFSFLARRVTPGRRPDCPRCGRRRIERRPSRFAVSRGLEEDAAAAPAGHDEAALDRALETLAKDAGSLDDADPRQAAGFLRRLYDTAGLPLTGPLAEAVRRMESGEDPERIEDDLGDALEGDQGLPEPAERVRRLARRALPPAVDATLYEL